MDLDRSRGEGIKNFKEALNPSGGEEYPRQTTTT